MVTNLQKTFAMQNRKQRFIAVALVIVLLILIWEIFGLFFSSPTPPPVKKHAAPNVARANTNSANPNTSAAPNPYQLTSDPSQQKYLQLLEQYKLVELQKMIAADQQAIAASQAATASSINKINEMGGQVNLQSLNFGATDNTDTTVQMPQQKTTDNTTYSLQYTGLQDNSWTATLQKGDSTYDVMIGTVLNGKYKVTDINNDEVVLEGPENTLRVSFDGSSITPNPKPTQNPPAPTPAKKAEPTPASGTAVAPSSQATAAPTAPANAAPMVVIPKNPAPKPLAPAPKKTYTPTLWDKLMAWFGPKQAHAHASSSPATGVSGIYSFNLKTLGSYV